MKTLTKIILALTGLAMVCCAHATTNDQSKDSIRVVVVNISKAMVVPAQSTNAPAAAGLRLVYIVEALGKTPIQNGYLGKIGFKVDGKHAELSKKADDETLIVASDYLKFDWKKLKKPMVSDPRRVDVYDYTIPYFTLPKGKTDLYIEAGFNLNKASFVFSDISIE